ncbi:putative ABC exporter domain-containing protein [Stieleria sp. JC731]|uniref:putative ABC exporter domain-containing protein n=1 Tax=Pirellulaceae TaxID=2691357 RepID=UPI001E387A5A|nr:putative ABC exporter domain-containing protein [Stieleria sp. JC731]MCC9601805.1 putative ABC exporter domain-containing protein [Stieleria sp. JC731]
MIHPALVRLTWMLTKAGLRHLYKRIKTPAGAVFAVVILGFLGFAFGPSLILLNKPTDLKFEGLATYGWSVGPVALFSAAVIAVLTDSGKSMLDLRPPELQFVLAGPFTSHQILTYRLWTIGMGLAPVCLMCSLGLKPHFQSWIAATIGVFLSIFFIFLIAFHYTLLLPRLSTFAVRSIRILLLGASAAVAAESAYNILQYSDELNFPALADCIGHSYTGTVFGFLFRPFAFAALSPLDSSLLLWASVSFGLLSLVTISCYINSVGFAELAVAGVARRQKRIERIRSGNFHGASRNDSKQYQSPIPTLPFMHGAGPIAWTELTTMMRRTGKLLIGLMLLSLVASITGIFIVNVHPETLNPNFRTYSPFIGFGTACYVAGLISVGNAIGLARPSKVLTWYKLVPIDPLAIAVGALAGQGAIFFCIQFAIQLPTIIISSNSLLQSASMLVPGFAFAIVLSSLTNLIATLTGLRPIPQGTPDIFQGTRVLFFMLLLGIGMIPPAMTALGTSALVASIFGMQLASFALGGSAGALVWVPAIWWITGRKFHQSETINAD